MSHHHLYAHFFPVLVAVSTFSITSQCLQTNLVFITATCSRRPFTSSSSVFATADCENSDEDEPSTIRKRLQRPADDNPLPSTTDLTPGKPDGYFIVQRYDVAADGFSDPRASGLFREADVKRLGLTSANVTLPSALNMLDPDRYPDVRSSLAASRDGSILIQRFEDGGGSDDATPALDASKFKRGRVGDRVFPNDVLHRQERRPGASERWHASRARAANDPSLVPNLSIVYEDDHVAIVNKPGGVDMFAHPTGGGDGGERSVKDLLPLAVRPPARGVADVLALPEAAHRLDKPTSGLLLVAKTRPALRHLSAQFRGLEIEKTYTAICYGVPKATHGEKDVGITEAGASNEGRLVGEDSWHLTDEPLDGKSATTLWRVLKHFNHGNVGLTLLELKPKTGRYRQLRRHMAKTHGCPLVGDSVFAKGIEKDGVGVPSRVAKLGLFLCSNAVRFEHPHFEASRDEWSESASTARLPPDGDRVDFRVKGSRVIVDASIRLPQRFDTLMERCDDFIGE